jgi:CheY-like chemotaxis protein
MAMSAGLKLKILVVEDDTEKLGAIIREILNVGTIELEQITDARDAVKAKQLMQQVNFDLLVLDIQIPLRIDQNASREVGLELLREISTRPIFKCPYHIIGITAYDDIHEEIGPAFMEQLWVLLKYDPTSDGWARQLRNKVEYLNRSKRLLRHSDGLVYETDLAILTALDEIEFSAVRALPVTWTDAAVPNDGSHYIQSTFSQDERQLSVASLSG